MEQLKKLVRPYRINYYKRKNKSRFEKAIKDNAELKLVVGSSGKFEEGWIPSERDFLNLLEENDWHNYFEESSINNILAEHVWEHLTPEEGVKAATVCHKFLKSNGRLRIAVPDGYHSDDEYIEYVKVNGWGRGAHDHKILYDHKSISKMLEQAGFRVELLEYFDDSRNFKSNEWNLNDGYIYRRNGQGDTNPEGIKTYTSLIVDGIKE